MSRNSLAEFRIIEEELGVPFMLKSRTEAYDGRGNFPVHSENDFLKALQALDDKPLYAERWIDFRQELAVMIVKTEDKPSDKWHLTTKAFPVVETIHENSICKLVYAPARGVTGKICFLRQCLNLTILGAEKKLVCNPPFPLFPLKIILLQVRLAYVLADALRAGAGEVVLQAQELARKAIASFWGKGVFGVEMFLMKDSTERQLWCVALLTDNLVKLMVNEIAPRPHNSYVHDVASTLVLAL